MISNYKSFFNARRAEASRSRKSSGMYGIARLLPCVNIALVLTLSACAISSKTSELLNHPAPATKITLLDGEYKLLNEFKGKPTVIVFWNALCAHCLNLMPKLEEIAAQKSQEGIQFLAVSINTTAEREDLLDQIAYLKLDHFTHAFSGNDIYDEAYLSFGANQVPFIAVLNEEGTIVELGEDTSVLHSLDRRNS